MLNFKIRFLQIINHILFFYGIYYVFVTGEYIWLFYSFISFILIGIISPSVTLHRLLAHRSFKTYVWLENILSFLSIYTTIGPTIAFVGQHRLHHAKPDTTNDPHSPYISGFWNVFFHRWKNVHIPSKYVKDLTNKKLHIWIFKHYFKIIYITNLILALINPLLVVFLYSIPCIIALYNTSLVNTLGHWHGYRTYNTNDKSTNSWIAGYLTCGEGWQNNHHHSPYNWCIGEKWWELDIGSWIVRLIKIK